MSLFGGDVEAPDYTPIAKEMQLSREEMIKRLDNVDLPTLQQLSVQFSEYDPNNIWAPILNETILQRETNLGNIQEDPALRTAQMKALDELGAISEAGITPAEEAQYYGIMDEMGVKAKGMRGALESEARASGQWGSGLDIANRMVSNQSSINEASRQGLGLAESAWNRKMDALKATGAMSGDIRAQDWSQSTQVAQNQDIIDQFNTANRNQTAATNVGMQNLAGQEKQRYSEQNRAIADQQQQSDALVAQQMYANEMGKTGAINTVDSTAATNIANLSKAQIDADAAATASNRDFMGGVLGVAGTIGAAYMSGGATLAVDPNVTGAGGAP